MGPFGHHRKAFRVASREAAARHRRHLTAPSPAGGGRTNLLYHARHWFLHETRVVHDDVSALASGDRREPSSCHGVGCRGRVLTAPTPEWVEATQGWTVPRTPDGRPTFRECGSATSPRHWSVRAEFAGRERLTDAEVAELRPGPFRSSRTDEARLQRPSERSRRPSKTSTPSRHSRQAAPSAWSTWSSGIVRRWSCLPQTGRIPALTTEARRRQKAVDDGWRDKTGPEDLNSIHRCITTGVPRVGGNFGAGPYTYYQLIQNANTVVLLSEAFHDARIIPLDGGPHLTDRIRQWNGDSRGRWDGDSLEVATRNFSVGSHYRGSAEGLHLVERFTRNGCRHPSLPGHVHRPDDLGIVLDRRASPEAAWPTDLRVCLPRREPLAGWHAANGENGRATAAQVMSESRLVSV